MNRRRAQQNSGEQGFALLLIFVLAAGIAHRTADAIAARCV